MISNASPAVIATLTSPVARSASEAISQECDVRDGSAWDDRLASFPNATIFQSSAWFRTLHRAYGFQSRCFVAGPRDADRVLVPLIEVQSWLTGRRGVCLPFTDECAPLFTDAEALRSMFREICACGRRRGWRYVEVRGACETLAAAASLTFLGHRLTLTPDTGRLFSRFASSTRRAIRKAEESGVSIVTATTVDAMSDFHALVCRTRRRQGLPPAPFRLFEAVRTELLLPGHGMLLLAQHAGKSIAGAVFLHRGRRAVYKYGASDERFQAMRANNLVMWHAIRRYADHGFETLDFGRTSPSNVGLRSFKLGWGATEYPIEYCKYDLRREQFVTDRDRATGWHTHFFRLLPPALSRLIGALLYRHIA